MQSQTTTTHDSPETARGGGGRVASAALRASHARSDRFAGLEEGEDRYAVLLLVKKAGKLIGLTPRAIDLLEYYVAFTRDCDWSAGGGSRPIVYQSVTKTALDLGVSERYIQKLEVALFEAGCLTWHDSGGHKRYGRRCPDTGRIVFAYGADLSPMADLRERLERLLDEKRRRDEEWLSLKRQCSYYRRQIRALLLEAGQDREQADEHERRYDDIAVQIRTHLKADALRSLLDRHKSLHSELLALVGGAGTPEPEEAPQRASIAKETAIGSCTSEEEFAHSLVTNQEPSDKSDTSSRTDAGFQESVTAPPEPTDPVRNAGLAHMSLEMMVDAAGPRFRDQLPNGASWCDLVEAANRVRRDYGVSQSSWGDACAVLGRNGAALCVLLVDHGAQRADNPVRTPAAYFRAMVRRARVGELHLHRSLFGLVGGGGVSH